jgi:hypothetical protein
MLSFGMVEAESRRQATRISNPYRNGNQVARDAALS